jgi:GNAT superfamily N-acetyltransferase
LQHIWDMNHSPRPARAEDIAPLAEIWRDGWREAHEVLAPPGLTERRMAEDFTVRLRAFGDDLITAGPVGAPLGLVSVKGDELNQMFTSPAARGTGIAKALLSAGEERIAESGHQQAWLDVMIGNDRAAAFYRKCGWRLRGEQVLHLDTRPEPFEINLWVFEKDL